MDDNAFSTVLLEKKIIKNGIWMYLLQFFNTIVPLLTLPYITRILGTSKYGLFSIVINILGYYQVIVDYGFDLSATRKVALLSKNKQYEKLSYIFSSVLSARMFLNIMCWFISLCMCFFIKDNMQVVCLFIVLLSLFGNCIQLNWLFQGLEEMKFISIINIFVRGVSVILIFLTVKTQADLFLYCMLYSFSPICSGLMEIILARCLYKIKFVPISIKNIVSELKEGWYVFTTQLSSKVFGSIGITFLGIFALKSEVGIYSAIHKIPNIMMLGWIPIGQVLYPLSSKKMNNSFENGKLFVRKMRLIFVPIFLLFALIVCVFSKQIVSFAFGTDYIERYYWVFPLLGWLVVSIDNNFTGVQMLLGGGYDKEYSACFQKGVICTIILNFVLIYLFQGNGASIAPLMSELYLGMLLRNKIREINNRVYTEEI